MTATFLALALALAASPGAPEGGAAGSPERGAPPDAPAATPRAEPLLQYTPAAPAEGPDVELHVPRAEIGKLSLEVENLQARLDVDTRVAGLVSISAGVVATVQKLKMQLEGAQAETHLVVRLERVTDVLERALGTIDLHPELGAAPGAASAAAPAPVAAQPIPAVSVDAAAGARDPQPPPAQE